MARMNPARIARLNNNSRSRKPKMFGTRSFPDLASGSPDGRRPRPSYINVRYLMGRHARLKLGPANGATDETIEQMRRKALPLFAQMMDGIDPRAEARNKSRRSSARRSAQQQRRTPCRNSSK